MNNNVPNLDEMTEQELRQLFRDTFQRRLETARKFFPDRPKGYSKAAKEIGTYAYAKATALRLRDVGETHRAEKQEAYCKLIYLRMPVQFRWQRGPGNERR